MPKRPIDPEKVVVFTGAGVSAPSGIPTYRGHGGLWRQHRFEDVASPEAWRRQPELVLEFYNERRAHAAKAQPNPAHLAIAELERRFKVVVVTQNVDDLHERGGSSQVIHLHGELRKARSTVAPDHIRDLGGEPIQIGDRCPAGGQWRPHIVWFGEEIMHYTEAEEHISEAGRLLVVGTSLSVFPAAGLIEYAQPACQRAIVDLDLDLHPYRFEVFEGPAEILVPQVVEKWIKEAPRP